MKKHPKKPKPIKSAARKDGTFHGLIRLVNLIDFELYLMRYEWNVVTPHEGEIMRMSREGMKDLVVTWDSEKKRSICGRREASWWYIFEYFVSEDMGWEE